MPPRGHESKDREPLQRHEGGDAAAAAPVEQSAIRSMETTHKSKVVIRCKVVIVGDAHVGKSAITQMFHSDGANFPKNYLMTLGVDFCVKIVKVPNTNVEVEMYLYDSAGQSVFHQRDMGTAHWEGATVVMAVYDCSNKDSFTSTSRWLGAVRAVHEGRPVPGVLIANKIDMRDQGVLGITPQEGLDFARQNGLDFFEVSALRNQDVNAPFHFVADAICKKYSDFCSRAANASM